jgi:phosphatidylinositol alpha-mannosyltransferase
LLKAFAQLVADRPDLRLLVAGPGEPEQVLSQTSAEVGARVTFLGRVSEADKARMLRSVDIYAAPNIGRESFGMILTEAMAAGTPVVASDFDAFRAVLDSGRAGVLFPVGDVSALATALDSLLDDRPRRTQLAGLARQVVAAHDWPLVADRILEVYSVAIEAAAPWLRVS